MLKEEFLFRILVCFILSFLVGIERQFRGRSVGLRTTILVSLAAFLFVTFSFLVKDQDITRIASQVVCGIGFLGAGVIIKDGINVRGLTTAATLWCDAAIGVLCTGGFIFEAVVGTLIILFANIILRFINKKIADKKKGKTIYDRYKLNLICDSQDAYVLKRINDVMNKSKIIINEVQNNMLDDGKASVFIEFDIEEKRVKEISNIMQMFGNDKDILNFSLNRENVICVEDEEEL